MRVLYLKEKVAIGRSLLQGRCQEREVAIGGSWHLWRGRDREIAPTGEVSGERGRHRGKLAFMEKVAIGRSLLQGRCQERVAIGGSWHLWRGRDREIAPTGEVSGERGRHRGKLAFMERSRSGDRSYRGGVRERVAIGGSWHLWRGRDREIAPTENLTEKRILR